MTGELERAEAAMQDPYTGLDPIVFGTFPMTPVSRPWGREHASLNDD